MAIKIAGVEVINDNRELILAQLAEINESIDDTAVDVFVYDTSKDTDGGAWRHRTQQTSWYNEGASSTRGTRAEFPAVAVIVAESNKVTIYDGDDPSLPMWMVFNRAGDSYFASGSAACSSVVMSNGLLVFGTVGTREISFLTDSALFRNSSGANDCSEPISGRNSGNTFSGYYGTGIVNNTVNDVAMTVLPDAPTDPVTGLPVPTIAVATSGGVSVIKDDGTVVDSSDTFEFKTVDIDDDILFFTRAAGATAGAPFFVEMPITSDGFSATKYRSNSASGGIPVMKGYPDKVVIGADESDLYTGSVSGSSYTGGVTHLAHRSDDYLKSMVAYTTSTYATGWMNGDIKLAALADTDATGLVGGNEVEDAAGGTFDTLEGVIIQDNNILIESVAGELEVTLAQGGGSTFAGVSFPTISGHKYTVTCYGRAGTNASGVVMEARANNINGAFIGGSNSNVVTDGVMTSTFTAASSTTTMRLIVNASARPAVGYFDNLETPRQDPDRSVKGNGLIVNGTITKAPVATGADVVGYSGFSTSNYLEQPYNSDLDFGAYTGTAGTGDFCVMGWVKAVDTGSTYQYFCGRGTSTEKLWLRVNTDDTFSVRCGATQYTSTAVVPYGTWAFVVLVRKDGVLKAYINNVEFISASNSDDLTLADATFRIAHRTFQLDNSFQGSLALFRISATAPTADQIKKIYEDEKVLFQEGAKATLYGSSDAVTALAHDPVTDLLHVGTSSGRSVFQGLKRVEESTGTDSQSLAAISAVDGLVVEGK